MFSCFGKDPDTIVSPDINAEDNVVDYGFSEDLNVERNLPDIIRNLRMDIKKLNAEMDYQYESLNKLEAQPQIWANPFAIYNKEIVLNNGSSIFGKIVYQDQDVMKVETLIGQLIIDRSTIIRVVNQVSAYGNINNESSRKSDLNNSESDSDPSGANLIQLYTALIFRGPKIVNKIKNELVDLMKTDGFKNIKEVVGKDT